MSDKIELHLYVSTSCQHGLHTRCRLQCKFCRAKCLCPCHLAKVKKEEPEFQKAS